MAIGTLDNFLAGLAAAQGFPILKPSIPAMAHGFADLFLAPGNPGPGGLPPADGEFPTTLTPGAIPFRDPTAGLKKYIGRAQVAASAPGTLVLYDRIWHQRLNRATAAPQAITWPAGLQRYDDGLGVELFAELLADLPTVAAATWSASFTDDAGSVGRIATAAYGASSAAHRLIPFSLPSGAAGVRSVEEVTLGGAPYASGEIGLVLIKRLASFPITAAGMASMIDALGALTELQGGACLSMMVATGASASTGQVNAWLDLIEG